MDKLILSQLTFLTTIGVFPWEKKLKQTVLMDLELGIDCQLAAKNDDIKDAVDYSKLSEQLAEFVSMSEFNLIETLAEKSAAFLLSEFAIKEVKLTLSKPGAVKNAKNVSVSICRNS